MTASSTGPRAERNAQLANPRLAHAESLLQPTTLGPSASAKQRMWGQIAGSRRPLFTAPLWLPMAAAATAGGLIWLASLEFAAPMRRITASRPQVLNTGGARLALGERATVEVSTHATRTDLRLFAGTVDVTVEAPDARPVFVHTTWARLDMVTGRFRVDVRQDGLSAMVTAGTLRVSWAGETRIIRTAERFDLTGEPVSTLAPTPEVVDTRPPSKPSGRSASTEAQRLKRRAPASNSSGNASVSIPARRRAGAKSSASSLRPAREQAASRALKRARSDISADPTKAAATARQWQQRGLPARLDVEALSIRADAARLSGDRALAAELYHQVHRHPQGAPYAEEAVLRQARLLVEMKHFGTAQTLLEEASLRFAEGPLEPERTMLLARILLEQNRAAEAAMVLSQLDPSRRVSSQWTLRLAAARVLFKRDRSTACDLVAQPPSSNLSTHLIAALRQFSARRCARTP